MAERHDAAQSLENAASVAVGTYHATARCFVLAADAPWIAAPVNSALIDRSCLKPDADEGRGCSIPIASLDAPEVQHDRVDSIVHYHEKSPAQHEPG